MIIKINYTEVDRGAIDRILAGRIMMCAKILPVVFVILLTLAGKANAAHPLITDDTGTQGKGKAQLEIVGEYGHDIENGVKTNSLVVPTMPVLSYGIANAADIVFGLSYQRFEAKQDEVSTEKRGLSDASIELKVRLYEKDGLSVAVKPGVSLPTGDESKGLGNGRTSYRIIIITTKDLPPWAFHLNLGYIRNEYGFQADGDANRKDIWQVSLASQKEIIKKLKAVANIGMEKSPDKTSDSHPAFILGGIIYSVTENLDADFGVKGALNKPETDISYLAGITWRL